MSIWNPETYPLCQAEGLVFSTETPLGIEPESLQEWLTKRGLVREWVAFEGAGLPGSKILPWRAEAFIAAHPAPTAPEVTEEAGA